MKRFRVTGECFNRVVTDPAYKRADEAIVTVVYPDEAAQASAMDGATLICTITPAERKTLRTEYLNELGAALVAAIAAADRLFSAHAFTHCGVAIGEDGYGADYAADILNGLHAMLNYEVGMADCGKLSTRIHAIAAAHGLLTASGDISGDA